MIFRRIKKPDKKEEEEWSRQLNEEGVSFKELSIMVITGLITILPVCFIVLVVLALLAMLILGIF